MKQDTIEKKTGKKFREYNNLNLPEIAKEILSFWKKNKIFEKSIENRKNNQEFVFYEGPPSANGLPGIHHVMSRTIKDVFCRYKTLKGFKVIRKAGWDTHGLPVELEVEKKLGITKEDIGKKISINEYNKRCKEAVMKYTSIWNDLTEKIGFWLDIDNPYISYKTKYIESVWYLLKKIYDKKLLYKGYSVQPYSPAAGTALSSHELNQPGSYKIVKDTSIVAQFKVIKNSVSSFLFENTKNDVFLLAWTTTPWTLPSNTALSVGKDIDYVEVETFNKYTGKPITVVLAKSTINKWFNSKGKNTEMTYTAGNKILPFRIIKEFKGSELTNIRYEQLLPYAQPKNGDAFKVVLGDFVTTDEGTGIVHTAPSFGADDFKTAQKYGLGTLTLVDKQGRFTKEVSDFAGEYVKEEYISDDKKDENYLPVDVKIAIKLKKENKAFHIEKYEHSYPHCWRTDKPILYYPLNSWFIKTTAVKDKLIKLNKTINWKPKYTGEGRFANWLENLVDWNLSRSRFWGIPLPIWTSKDGKEQKCIGSLSELKKECDKAVKYGFMKSNPLEQFKENDFSEKNYDNIDLHRPFVDEIILVSPSGKKMYRENDLIDVWFDSGSMPYAQWHYPFENKELIDKNLFFPADFIAEGVDQTRGWFFTLHTIASICFDSVAYKNVISNGLVLDKDGQKMSKRLGNVVDPFKILEIYGPDATRWYMLSNSHPWENLKFDEKGIKEVRNKFFGTLYNTYAFFALYANVDNFSYEEEEIPVDELNELDRWILSKLNSLIKTVNYSFDNYDPTKAAREIENFVIDHLSNWYVRLSRRRFWKGKYSKDKVAAYQTLYKCIDTVAHLIAPLAPFYADRLFKDLNEITGFYKLESVHLSDFPKANEMLIDKNLEEKMEIAQVISSLVLSIRKKEKIKVRQPLQKILIPVIDEKFVEKVKSVKELILSEVNVKDIDFVKDTSDIVLKKVKANFKKLGPKYGKLMKEINNKIQNLNKNSIEKLENEGYIYININNKNIKITKDEVEIIAEDIPGFSVANQGVYTVALDINITDELKYEGIARELVNRIQKMRKEKKFNVTDKIIIKISNAKKIKKAIEKNFNYICRETLAKQLILSDDLKSGERTELDKNTIITIAINKLN